MSPRSLRRAAERRAEKEARQVFRLAPAIAGEVDPTEQPMSPSPQLLSDALDWEPDTPPSHCARHAANLRNAQLSTGPRTPVGKQISSMNAVKTGLTGRTVLLPTDDADAYRAHLAAYTKEHQPNTPRESELVQSLADTGWRLARIPALESAIYTRGRYESAEMYANHPPAERIALLDLETHLRYEKQLRNLQLQESRLHRRYTLDLAELRRLQAERSAAAPSAAKTTAAPAAAPNLDGFVFATPRPRLAAAPSTATFAPEIDTQKAA